MMNKSILALCVSAALLTACSSVNDEDARLADARERRATLAELDLQPSPLVKVELPKMEASDLKAAFHEVLGLDIPEEIKANIRQRVAILELLEAEEAQLNGTPGSHYYNEAIAALTAMIDQNPGGVGNDRLLYQLAKAYDLQGQQAQSFAAIERLIAEHPDNDYMLELQFRRAEILFSQKRYSEALASYSEVIATRDNNPFYHIGLYMHGWSLYKMEADEQALVSFTQLLDALIIAEFENIWTLDEMAMLIPKGDQQLLRETFDVMTLIFSYSPEGGGDSIAAHYDRQGERPYTYLNYQALGEFYLEKQRYTDSVDVYDEFVKRNPNHPGSVWFSKLKMDALVMGNFPTQLMEEKLKFAATYELNSPYWDDKSELNKQKITPVLMDLLQELAQNAHADAQAKRRIVDTAQNPTSAQKTAMADAYQQTARWYQLFLSNFPGHERSNEIMFYLAESYYETEQYRLAAKYFEQVAYQQENDPNGAEAAYALILSQEKLLAQLRSAPAISENNILLQEYKAQFILRYGDDPRSTMVQNDIIQEFFKEGEYEKALLYANSALENDPRLTLEERISALLVIGHSHFAMEDYKQAEMSYEKLLVKYDHTLKRYSNINDRLAASIYRQAEEAIEAGELQQAVDHFARIIRKAPDSPIRLNAQYDMATYLLEMEQWHNAIDQLHEFRVLYPNHRLSKELLTKLAFAYQQTEQWEQAANYLKMIWSEKPQSEETREMLWLAAETYEKAGNRYQALRSYRVYAHTYPQPLSVNMEAQYKMSEFYRENGDTEKREFWLQKLIASDNKAGEQRSDRSKYLAAMASINFAEQAMDQFSQTKLTLPLAKSLKKKRALLDTALAEYNKTLSYGVAEFTTKANYQIGAIYNQLAADLMNSQRPQGLDELELEQYDILLEEQAFPFEDKAIAIHEQNVQRSWNGMYNEWIQESFTALSKLLPGRYDKQEVIVEVVDEFY
ncbi:tetratricopeptide repeat protein [Thalassotalea mangrovi]|uniref:Tetratricopeptide repeat protein n=1 Tax=Thalassotalea mangrovi TaxID=2572245 RepID=A0A4U1B833_9GAMM|nr:tetratricopeptide repeat protein [Thalassotalea mangrovi]TKB46093.1 tetratricopeptide repeat protein [Thalassotalea mangrovi]